MPDGIEVADHQCEHPSLVRLAFSDVLTVCFCDDVGHSGLNKFVFFVMVHAHQFFFTVVTCRHCMFEALFEQLDPVDQERLNLRTLARFELGMSIHEASALSATIVSHFETQGSF